MKWKHIKESPNYAISNTGKLIRTYGGQGSIAGRLITPCVNATGYLQVALHQNGKRRTARINRLVLMAFGDKAPADTECNHKNGIKADNRIENLEWMTHSENIKHSFRLGLQSNVGEANPRAKLNKSDVSKIRGMISAGMSCVSISKLFNVTDVLIGRIKHKKAWAHI